MKNPKLNQIIAIETGTKNKAERDLTDEHHILQKPQPLTGISRSFNPKFEEGAEHYETIPAENTKVQKRCQEVIARTGEILTELFDITATKDFGNTLARADVVVDGTTILAQVPVTNLLFLEKQLDRVYTFVQKLPTLDPSETWALDANQNCYATLPVETNKTKRVKKVLVKAQATDKHPAQTEVYDEDVVTGRWKTIKFSGALPQTDVTAMLDRVQKLQKAVKFAREEANNTEVPKQFIGKKVFDYLFAVKG